MLIGIGCDRIHEAMVLTDPHIQGVKQAGCGIVRNEERPWQSGGYALFLNQALSGGKHPLCKDADERFSPCGVAKLTSFLSAASPLPRCHNLRSQRDALPAQLPEQEPVAIRTPERQWLSEVLGVCISDLQTRVVGESRGFISTTWQLRLSTDPPGLLPATLVLKSESSNPMFHALGRERRSFEREIRFYRELASSVEAHLPRIHATGAGDDVWLLMEDLSHLRPGDQVRGLRQQEVRAVVRRMAAIHAHFWRDASLQGLDWLPSHRYWFSDPDLGLLEAFLQEYGLRIGPQMAQLLPEVMAQLPLIDAEIASRPFTLIHGDLRADNLMFGGDDDDPDAAILDWQTACRDLGALDLAYLLGGSEPSAERQGHLDELLYLWHGELLAHGVADYPLQEARHDLQLGALRCLAAAIRLYATLHHSSTSVRSALFKDEAIERHCAAVLELQAWQALPRPL